MKRGHTESEAYYGDLFERSGQRSLNRSLAAAARGGVSVTQNKDGTYSFKHPAIDADRAIRHKQIETYAAAHRLELGMPVNEWVAEQKAQDDSQRKVAVVQALMTSGQDVAARKYFERYQDEIRDPD